MFENFLFANEFDTNTHTHTKFMNCVKIINRKNERTKWTARIRKKTEKKREDDLSYSLMAVIIILLIHIHMRTTKVVGNIILNINITLLSEMILSSVATIFRIGGMAVNNLPIFLI